MIRIKPQNNTQHLVQHADDQPISSQLSPLASLWPNYHLDWPQQRHEGTTLDDASSFTLLDHLSAQHRCIDAYTVKHQQRVAQLCQALALELGYDLIASRWLYYCGLMHDLGKALLPLSILHRRDPLSDSQRKLIRSHVELSHAILSNYHFSFPIAEIVLQHHERINGSGYPKGLTGAQMYPEVHILIAADMMESISLARSYRAALGEAHALAQIQRQAGISLDAAVCEALSQLFTQHRFSFDCACTES